jgi:putative hemolysin
MVPRAEVVALEIGTPVSRALDVVLEHRFERFPVYEGDIDRVIGVVHEKDVARLARDRGDDLRSIVRPVSAVPGRKRILELLGELQESQREMAIVQDEFGVTWGLVNREDIFEELVGELRDEFDAPELATIRHLPDGSFRALGTPRVRDFNRETGWAIPASGADTLASLLVHHLGRDPAEGDQITVGVYVLAVEGLDGSRITTLQVRRSG